MRWIIGLFLFSMIACAPKKVEIDGQYIKAIERNNVLLENGDVINLDASEGAKTIYLIRHAEKDTLPEGNPILTDEGYERSYRLAEMFKKSRLDAIYSTLYNRTLHTVDSLGNSKGLRTMIYQPKDLREMEIKLTEDDAINQILVVGHSNTTPALANVFMGHKVIDAGFPEDDYDNFLVVNISPEGQKKLYQLKYK